MVRLWVWLTRVGTAPGFWFLSTLTTWKTSMDPSVLQHSIQAASAQNMADRITVSLQNHKYFN